jgi:Type II intron maturase
VIAAEYANRCTFSSKGTFKVTHHIWELKKILNWVLRYSLLATLSAKFKSSLKRIIDKYSIAPKVEYAYTNLKNGTSSLGILASYPTKKFFNHKKKEFSKIQVSSIKFSSFLKVRTNSLNIDWGVRGKCVISVCRNDSKEIHYIKKLARRLRPAFSSLSGSYLFQGWKVIDSVLAHKQVIICKSCYNNIYLGAISKNDFDLKLIFLIKGKL